MIIYKITNTITGKAYIGQTVETLEKRWQRHCKSASQYSNHFMRAIKKYGTDCWRFEILEEVNDVELLNEREVYWIAYFETFKNGYNSTTGGRQSSIVTEEVKNKRSESMKRTMAEKFPVENRKVRPKFGSEEYCANMAKKSAERWKDPEYKQRVGTKISASLKGVTHRSGYKQTPEVIEKRTAKLRGKKFTESHTAALSAGQKNKVWWTNGIISTRALECPGEGWIRGRKINKTNVTLET